MGTTAQRGMSEEMQRCIDECLKCYSACTATSSHCQDMAGKHAAREHQTALLDCATLCQTSAGFMLRNSSLHARVCDVCAEACRRCEQHCRSMGGGDETMLKCADACRRCADSCERMASMTP